MFAETKLRNYLSKTTDAAPLALFRIIFGIMMLFGIIRFWSMGWIEEIYLMPDFHFKFYGFEWIKVLGEYTYLLFIIAAISAFCVAIGYKYKWNITIFFLSFTYIELMEKTAYLNHYYFISLVAFLMIFLPANAYYSLDAKQHPKRAYEKIPRWTIGVIKLMLSLVYFYAGLAKLNSDWLLHAYPLKIWLPIHYDLPIVGYFMKKEWVFYAMSWGGAFYDIFIPFFLLWKPSRLYAYATVIFFHLFTAILFPIGMFPYIMILSTLIFFDAPFHRKVLTVISKLLKINFSIFNNGRRMVETFSLKSRLLHYGLLLFFVVQILMPWRHLLYKDELFWTEEGYRFSWRVMLMEKKGAIEFVVIDGDTGERYPIQNDDYLCQFQIDQMSFQPDFILEYAHYLGEIFQKKGIHSPAVYATSSFVTLNGRRSQAFIRSDIDLMQIEEGFHSKTFLLPFQDSILGL